MLKNHLDRQDSHFRSWRGICFEYGYGFENFCVTIFVYVEILCVEYIKFT